MTTTNDITGAAIKTGPSTAAFRAGHERVYGVPAVKESLIPDPPSSRKVLVDLVDALKQYGGSASLMHPRLTRAISRARRHIAENV